MEERKKPRQYAVAYCGVGALGLILSEGPVEVEYPDGTKGTAWTGIQLRHDKLKMYDGKIVKVVPGTPWSARNPKVVGYLEDLYVTFQELGNATLARLIDVEKPTLK